MLFGYVEDGSYTIRNDEDDPVLEADYYFGTNEDGARHTGWLQYTDALTDYEDDYYWFYFNTSNGKKVSNTTKSINGKKYVFDTKGVMKFKWVTTDATGSEATKTSWYGKLDDGSLAKNKWIWNKPYSEEYAQLKSTEDDYNDETERWFRTGSDGKLVTGQTKKINSKWYAFDEDGVMRTGLVRLNQPSVSGAKVSGLDAVEYTYGVYDMDDVTKKDIQAETDPDMARALHYFSEDEEKDGSMKTGTIKIELADDEYTFCFTKTTGAAKHGYDKSGKKVYNNGILQKAGDDKYKVVKNPCVEDGQSEYYLVGTTGNVVTAVNKYKDANDQYYVLLKGENGQYIIGKTYDEDAAKAAVKAGSISKINDATEDAE